MRAYLPIGWPQLGDLHRVGELDAPLPGFAVDPQWRLGAPDVDEEEWEYEAQALAADALPENGGVVLAVDLDSTPSAGLRDGAFDMVDPVLRRHVAAVLDADLAWYGTQEIPALLAERPGR